MCDKVVLGNEGMLMFITDCCKYQTMCNKAVDNYPHELGSVTNCYETQNMLDKAVSIYPSTIQFFYQFESQETCDKAFDAFPFVFDSALDRRYITQELQDKVVSEDPFMLKCCHNKYKTQEMCDKMFDSCLLALKVFLYSFITCRMIENFDNAVFHNDHIALLYSNFDYDFFTIFSSDNT